jgi:hypothetical protein
MRGVGDASATMTENKSSVRFEGTERTAGTQT